MREYSLIKKLDRWYEMVQVIALRRTVAFLPNLNVLVVTSQVVWAVKFL